MTWSRKGSDNFKSLITIRIAHCMDLAQKFQKIVSKSCFNYTFSMILTCEAVFVDNKSAVQV